MISFKEQIHLAIYFLLFGMFLTCSHDIIHYYLKRWNIKIIIGYIIQSFYWFGMVIISCLYVYNASEGRISVYTFGFFFLGYLIHRIFLGDTLSDDLNRINSGFRRVYKKIKNWLIELVYPKEVLSFVSTISKNIYKKIFKKKKKRLEKSNEDYC